MLLSEVMGFTQVVANQMFADNVGTVFFAADMTGAATRCDEKQHSEDEDDRSMHKKNLKTKLAVTLKQVIFALPVSTMLLYLPQNKGGWNLKFAVASWHASLQYREREKPPPANRGCLVG